MRQLTIKQRWFSSYLIRHTGRKRGGLPVEEGTLLCNILNLRFTVAPTLLPGGPLDFHVWSNGNACESLRYRLAMHDDTAFIPPGS